MPRRRSTKTRPAGGKPRAVNRADSKLQKWNKASDIPMDEEDLFHASKDKVLLESSSYRQTDDDDGDEVFALKGLEEEDDEHENVEMNGEDEDEDEDEEDVPVQNAKPPKSKKQKKKKSESSDEEESESEEETWGRNKSAYYSSNAAQLESDDEEGNDLEEQEAKRLQVKTREEMGEGDFGLDDALDVEGVAETDEFLEPNPVVITPLSQDNKLLLRHLEKTSPEALALARDWEDTAQSLTRTQEMVASLESKDPDALTLGMIHIYYQALLTYATTLAFYLHLRASEKYAQQPELLKNHPILQRLLTLKQSVTTLEDINFAEDDDDDDDDDEDDDESMSFNDILMDGENVWNMGEGLDENELLELLEDASSQKNALKSKEPPKKKRKTSSTSSKPIAPVFDLVEPVFSTSKSSTSRVESASSLADVYGEVTSLQHADAADKTARKKSLRFHTSKIESASARRQGARNQAAGGDDDLPYRERKKEKEARLAKESAAKVRGQGGADLNDTEPEHKPAKRSREQDGEDDEPEGPDGYYELIKKESKVKQEQKKAEYAAVTTRLDIDEGNASGPRSLTRTILANKGLTPHRPKSVRNPRVKKRLKFEKAKKKISSQKATYKGGLADTGRYDGEKSGISKVVKSVRLG